MVVPSSMTFGKRTKHTGPWSFHIEAQPSTTATSGQEPGRGDSTPAGGDLMAVGERGDHPLTGDRLWRWQGAAD